MTTISTACPNCSAVLHGQYCSECGQNQKSTSRYFWTLVNEAFEGIFSWNSKAFRTTFAMFCKPGFLTTEHLADRRARYVSPLRLYIVTSIVFFLTLSMLNFLGLNIQQSTTTPLADATTQSPASGASDSTQGVDPADVSAQRKEVSDAIADSDIEINLPFVGEEREKELADKFKGRLINAFRVATKEPERLIEKIIDSMPIVTFFLLPLNALILKFFYIRSGRYYAEHLVLITHHSSFLFAAFTLFFLAPVILGPIIGSFLTPIILVWTVLYFCLSLKRVYRQSWSKTISKSFAVGMLLFMLTIVGVMLASLIGVVLL